MSYYRAYATDPDADCNNWANLGFLGKDLCVASKGAQKQITGEGTALDPKLLAARDKAMTTPTPSNPDADCNTWGPFNFICTAGKSITKGGGAISEFFRKIFTDPRTLLLVGGVVLFVVFLLFRR